MNNLAKYAVGFFVGVLAGLVVEARVLRPLAHTEVPSPRGTSVQKEVIDQNKGKPELVVPNSTFNFGRREKGDVVRHTFTLKNGGRKALHIKDVRPACGCTTTEPEQNVLSPGEETELQVRLDLSRQKGEQDKKIALETNDPDQPVFNLTMRGIATSRVKLDPERVELGHIPATQTAKASVNVRATKELSFGVDRVKTSGDNIKAKYETIEEGHAYEVKIEVDPAVNNGLVRGWVQLLTDHAGEYNVIGIPVLAHVTPDGKSSSAHASQVR